jgi:hypothetical protein
VVKKPEGNKLHGRPTHKQQDHIKMNIYGTEWNNMNLTMWLKVGKSGRLL